MRVLLLALVYLPLILMPGATLNPKPTPFPTPIEVAQEWTFTDVGEERYVITYGNPRQVLGKVIIAGLQTTIIKLTYHGPFPASIVLCKEGACDSSCAVELYRITGTQREAFILVHHPAKLRHENVDSVVICVDGITVATTGAFPPPWGY